MNWWRNHNRCSWYWVPVRRRCHWWRHLLSWNGMLNRRRRHSIVRILPGTRRWLIISSPWRHHIRCRLIVTTILLSIVIHRGRRLVVTHRRRIRVLGRRWMHVAWSSTRVCWVMMTSTATTTV